MYLEKLITEHENLYLQRITYEMQGYKSLINSALFINGDKPLCGIEKYKEIIDRYNEKFKEQNLIIEHLKEEYLSIEVRERTDLTFEVRFTKSILVVKDNKHSCEV